MAALTRLVGGLCHDFNNFLTIIDGHTSVLRFLEGMPEEAQNSIEEIKRATKRASALSQQMLTFAQRQRLTVSRFSAEELLGEIRPELDQTVGVRATLEIQAADATLLVDGDRELLKQAIVHLVKNARDAFPKEQAGAIRISAELVKGETNFVEIAVHDSGTGIKPEVMPYIFDPYFTTKAKGSGKGLGLALVHGICHLHGGRIEITSETGVGTEAKILLPAAKAPATAEMPKSEGFTNPLESVMGTETILVVEDNENLRTLIVAVLEKLGYKVYSAESLVEARGVWDKYNEEIVLALVDLVLPEGRVGIDLAEEIVTDRPKLQVILMSGFVGTEEEREKIRLRAFPFIAKPFDVFQLAGAIRANLDGPANT